MKKIFNPNFKHDIASAKNTLMNATSNARTAIRNFSSGFTAGVRSQPGATGLIPSNRSFGAGLNVARAGQITVRGLQNALSKANQFLRTGVIIIKDVTALAGAKVYEGIRFVANKVAQGIKITWSAAAKGVKITPSIFKSAFAKFLSALKTASGKVKTAVDKAANYVASKITSKPTPNTITGKARSKRSAERAQRRYENKVSRRAGYIKRGAAALAIYGLATIARNKED